MVEERASESPHKKIVGQYILFGDVPKRQSRIGVVTHDKPAGIGVRSKMVVLAAGDLHLVLIKAVPQIARGDAERQIEAFGIVNRKGRIGQVLGLRLAHARHHILCGQPAPHRR